MPKTRWRTLAGLLLGMGILAASPAHAQTSCANDPFPSANAALDGWQQERHIGLTPQVRERLLAEFCGAGLRVSRGQGVSSGAIDAAARDALFEYLDATATTTSPSDTLLTVLTSFFSLPSGPSAPEPREMAVIRITYTHPVEWLRVDGRRQPRVDSLLAETGARQIAGMRANAALCQKTVNVVAYAVASFRC